MEYMHIEDSGSMCVKCRLTDWLLFSFQRTVFQLYLRREQVQQYINKGEWSMTIDCHWKTMDCWVVFCSGYNAVSLFGKSTMWFLSNMERGTLYKYNYPLWSTVKLFVICPPPVLKRHLFPPPGNALGSSVSKARSGNSRYQCAV